MADPIRISALGRDAQIGDLYNYFTDVISSSGIEASNERKTISETAGKWTFFFFHQQPEKFKHHILGINSHLLQSIKRGFVPGHQLWFDNYLHTNSMDGDEEHAQVTLFCRVVQRTETLDFDFIPSKIDDYQLRRADANATHVIDEVVYGAELICSMRKALDFSQETKESAELSIYFAAKKYLDETVVKSTSLKLPAELDQVSCTILNSIEPGEKNEMSFDSFNGYLQYLLSSETGNNQKKWKPIEFRLRNMIEARMWADRKADVALEKERHAVVSKWIKENDISNDPSLKRFPLLDKHVCYFQHLMERFWKNVEEVCKNYETFPLEKALEQMFGNSNLLNEIIDWCVYRRKELQDISWLLGETDLLLLDRTDIETRMKTRNYKSHELFVLKVEYKRDLLIHELEKLVGAQTSNAQLPVLPIFPHNKERLQSFRTALSEFANEAKLFTYGSGHGTNYHIGLDPSMLTDLAVAETAIDYSYQPTQAILVENAVERFKKQLQEFLSRNSRVNKPKNGTRACAMFSEEEENTQHRRNSERIVHGRGNRQVDPYLRDTKPPFEDTSTAKLPDNDETIRGNDVYLFDIEMADADYSKQPTSSTTTNSSMKQVYSVATPSNPKGTIGLGSGEESLNLSMEELQLSDAKEEEQSTTVAVQPTKSLNDGENKEQNSRVNKPRSDKRYTETQPLPSSEEECMTHYQERSEKVVDGRGKGKVRGVAEVDPSEDQHCRRTDQENREHHDNRRIAEIYADESRSYSTLIRKGSPKVFLLNAKEKFNDDNIRWFDICRPGGPLRLRSPKDHKIIILMGATGSGKSTLINGMVNYILGVQWNDPFRFKCVREDEGVSRNQAHSQTTSVTAYTLRHQKGMAIPYSITIIDTPGYGDTRGVKRDKEITATIHRFLSQQENSIPEIHAACFVAASGDSRLTATQRYIIDSVLSIFGKDMKANLRLLVTFADNADPPVVGACLSANFPTTSASGSIAYSKFNSSVLYCSNAKQGDDEFSFDELFWDMGHENFKKFFAMLEIMEGRDLKSTREVIQSRRQVEQSLIDIEQELEICLVTIENMEIFQEKMKICGYNMEATKNYMVEQMIMNRQMSKCKNGFMAYNCRNCNVTCEKYIQGKDPLHRLKRKCTNESCKCSSVVHELDKWEWRWIPEKVTVPLLEMKAKYESNFEYKMNVEQLLNACGDNLLVAKTKVLTLLEQVAKNAQLLESTALRSNVLSPSDYLSLMRSRVLEEQAPGYLTRLQTLDELQHHLTYGTPLTATKAVLNSPPPTYNSYNTGSGVGGYQGRSQNSQTTNQTSQQMSSYYYGTATATDQSSKKAEGEKTGKHSSSSYFSFFSGRKK